MVSYLSLDPRETNEKAYQIIYFGPQVPFKGTARLLGVPLDFQLTFGPDTDELKKRSGRLKVLRCLWNRFFFGQNPSSLRSLYCIYSQSCTLDCASSWLASTAANYLRKLESQHRTGTRIIMICSRSTPAVPLLRELGLLSVAVYANLAAVNTRQRALCHTQAQKNLYSHGAARSVKPPRIRRHVAGGAARKS